MTPDQIDDAFDLDFITDEVSIPWPDVRLVFGYAVLLNAWSMVIGRNTYILPARSKSNFGTVPWFARWLVSKADANFVIGFIIHDILCGEFNEPMTSWREANRALYVVNKAFTYKLGRWARFKRHLVYRAVQLNGWMQNKA